MINLWFMFLLLPIAMGLSIGALLVRCVVVFQDGWHKRIFHKCGYSKQVYMNRYCPRCGEDTGYGKGWKDTRIGGVIDCETHIVHHKFFGGFHYKDGAAK